MRKILNENISDIIKRYIITSAITYPQLLLFLKYLHLASIIVISNKRPKNIGKIEALKNTLETECKFIIRSKEGPQYWVELIVLA